MKRNLLLLLTLLLALLLSACSQINPTPAAATPQAQSSAPQTPLVSATGVIVPAQWTTLSVAGAGLIVELPVQTDEQVTAGQILLRLDGLEAAQAAISAVQLELTNASYALDILDDNPELRVAVAQQAVAQAEKAIDSAERRLSGLTTSAKQQDIDQARANVALAKDRMDKARKDFAPYENKPESNVIRAGLLSKKAQAEKDYEAAVRLLNNLQGTTTNPLDLSQAEADLAVAQAQLATAQREFEKLSAGPDPDRVRLAQARLDNARVQLAAAEAALDRLVLEAPFAGSVVELNVHQGEWVSPGQPVLVLADLAHLRVETTDLNEIDVARVQVGNTVEVSFDALPDVLVKGTVTRIAQRAAPGSGVNYTVEIELEETPPALRWGMTAFVDIQVEDK